jgi:hypothetical protein
MPKDCDLQQPLFENRRRSIEEHAQGEQFDAFMNALEKYIPQRISLPQLIDYAVRILQEAVLMPYAKP